MVDNAADKTKLVLCPYCGHAQHGGDQCQVCRGLFEPLSRRATQLAMGPWQVRDKHNPFRPGCCYDVIKKMATGGKIKPTTVMRGPTTRQFWSVARNVPGVAHLIGYCHECGNHVSPSDAKCGKCHAVFKEPRDRNALGLAYKDDTEAELGQRMLEAEIAGGPIPGASMPGPTKRSKPRPAKAKDLLDEVLDLSGDIGPSPTRPAAPAAPTKPMPAAAAPPTPPTGSPPAPPPKQQGKAVDFMAPQAPADLPKPTSAFDTEPTAPLPESSGYSPAVLLLIALNIIAIGAIIVFVVLSQ